MAEDWGEWGVRKPPHYLGCAAVKSPGIGFITGPNEIAEADYSCDGKETSWITLCWGEKSEGIERERKKGWGGRGVDSVMAVLPQQDSPNKLSVCESQTMTCGVGADPVPFFKQASLGRDMNNNDSSSAAR